MLNPIVFNTSEICHAHGVRHAVLSPGSRNAPLIISFARNDTIKKWVIPDERSAAFIALGIAQKLKEPVVLCCTSGTALLNYAPAIAEAFYREIPLIVLSADRPPELIDQRDGQTIRQFEALKNHVKCSKQLPVVVTEDNRKAYQGQLTDGLKLSQELARGPVHLNIPFREPFYPDDNHPMGFEKVTGWSPTPPKSENAEYPDAELLKGKKVLVLIGQSESDLDLQKTLSKLDSSFPILKSPLSNIDVKGIEHLDFFLKDQPELRPDVLISTGLSVLSKKLKNYLRKNKPSHHFHFDPAGLSVDTYQTDPVIVKSTMADFLEQVSLHDISVDYVEPWNRLSELAGNACKDALSTTPFSETNAFHNVLNQLPDDIELHIGNSMPVRFAELFGIKSSIASWSNRGTSGIDGCTSTALGTSLVSEGLNVLLIGDVSFLYDRNAFFHNYSAPNFRVIVFNNQGGGIFRLIEGPKKLPELEQYFETRHNRTAEYICAENKIVYSQVRSAGDLNDQLEKFYEPSEAPKLIEIFTDPATNESVFNELKQHIHEQINP